LLDIAREGRNHLGKLGRERAENRG
jgi:hypothetical protein